MAGIAAANGNVVGQAPDATIGKISNFQFDSCLRCILQHFMHSLVYSYVIVVHPSLIQAIKYHKLSLSSKVHVQRTKRSYVIHPLRLGLCCLQVPTGVTGP